MTVNLNGYNVLEIHLFCIQLFKDTKMCFSSYIILAVRPLYYYIMYIIIIFYMTILMYFRAYA